MSSRRLKPTEDDWLRHKPAIQRLYLIDDVPLKELVGRIGQLGLVVTPTIPTYSKAQLEYKLKKWNFAKNLDKSAWLYIGHRVEKRKREGKESQVIHNGKRLKHSTVAKEVDRHRDRSVLAQFVRESLGKANVSTSYSFSANSFQLSYPGLAELSSLRVEIALPKLAAEFGKFIPESFPGEHLRRSSTLLGRCSYDRFQERFALTVYEISNKLWMGWDKVKGYFRDALAIIRQSGLFCRTMDLASLESPTILAFAESLIQLWNHYLSHSISHSRDEAEEVADVFEWLFRCGIDLAFFRGSLLNCALENCILFGLPQTMQVLLKAGAAHSYPQSKDPLLLTALCRYIIFVGYRNRPKDYFGRNRGGLCEYPSSNINWLSNSSYREQSDVSADDVCWFPDDTQGNPSNNPYDDSAVRRKALEYSRVVDILVEHSTCVQLEKSLVPAITTGSMELVKTMVFMGAKLLSGRNEPEDKDVVMILEALFDTAFDEVTGTQMDASSRLETDLMQFVLATLERQLQPRLISSFITPDVLVRAGRRGGVALLEFLLLICPDIGAPDSQGFTCLHAAAAGGHVGACGFLIRHQVPVNTNPPTLSPLHVALLSVQYKVVELLVDSGADVDAVRTFTRSNWERMRTWENYPCHGAFSETTIAPMEALALSHSIRPDRRRADPKFLAVLMRAGAKLCCGCVVEAAGLCDVSLMVAILAAGGDPNETPRNKTALSRAALCLSNPDKATSAEAVIRCLLDAGANVTGEEVVISALEAGKLAVCYRG
ncbi:hypothetical protein CP533_2020 [Ophiocordyceps camponoti-saundersi (nom. inval.)]|nr:hypothetical protein CP533_2020 [Ophiocordyceps camponoti-saundersi (nom. inval.)]